MITNFKLTRKETNDVVDFISNKNNLYLTKDNKRYKVKTLKDLKELYSQSCFSLKKEQGGCTKGLLFVWKAYNSEEKRFRNYIKFEVENIVDLDDLLMVVNWNYSKEVYVKLDKDSKFVESFRKKGFKFCYTKDREVLLCRTKNDKIFIAPYKEQDE